MAILLQKMQGVQFLLLFTVGVFILFGFRVSYRVIAPRQVSGDAYGQLLQIQDIKEAGHRRPERPSKTAASGHYAYPYFALWALSFVPKRILDDVERFFSGIMDVIYALGFLVLVYLDVVTYQGALLSLAIFITTPQFMLPDLAHGRGLSSRKPGVLLTTASLLVYFYWVDSAIPLAFGLAILLGAAMVMTSKFSLQAYVFILIPTTVFVSPTALGLLALSLIVASLATVGRYPTILRTHLSHVYDYAVRKQYKRFDHSIPNPISFVRTLLNADSNKARLRLLKNNKRLRPFANNPFLTAVVVAVVLLGPEHLGLPSGYGVWIAGAIGAFVLTALPHMLFLGQAGRYLEYALYPSAVLIASAWTELGTVYQGIVLSLMGLGLLVEIFYIWSFQRFLVTPDRQDAFESLVSELKILDEGTVLIQPTYLSRGIAWETGNTVVEFLGGAGNSTEESTEELNTIYPDRMSFVTNDVEWLDNTFEPDWVVFDKMKIEELGLKENELRPPPVDPEFENEGFELYPFEAVWKTHTDNRE